MKGRRKPPIGRGGGRDSGSAVRLDRPETTRPCRHPSAPVLSLPCHDRLSVTCHGPLSVAMAQNPYFDLATYARCFPTASPCQSRHAALACRIETNATLDLIVEYKLTRLVWQTHYVSCGVRTSLNDLQCPRTAATSRSATARSSSARSRVGGGVVGGPEGPVVVEGVVPARRDRPAAAVEPVSPRRRGLAPYVKGRSGSMTRCRDDGVKLG